LVTSFLAGAFFLFAVFLVVLIFGAFLAVIFFLFLTATFSVFYSDLDLTSGFLSSTTFSSFLTTTLSTFSFLSYDRV